MATSQTDRRIVEHDDYLEHPDRDGFFDGARVLVAVPRKDLRSDVPQDGLPELTEADVVWQGDLIAMTSVVWHDEQERPVVWVTWRTNYSLAVTMTKRNRKRLHDTLQGRQASHPELDIAGLLSAFDAGEAIQVGATVYRERLEAGMAVPLRSIRLDPARRRVKNSWSDEMLDKVERNESAVDGDEHA